MEEARKQAKILGASRYKSERTCPRGHTKIWRYASNAICVQCDNEVLAPRRREKKRAIWTLKVVVGVCGHCGTSFEKSNNANRYCSLECRFWSKVEKRGPDECWPWHGSLNEAGRGLFFFGSSREDGRTVAAARVSYELSAGVPLSELERKQWGDLYVCHTCDHPPCMNPRHLYLGSHYTNMRDKVDRGRALSRLGYRKHKDRVDEVLALRATGISQMKIAAKTGINQASVSEIIRGVYLERS